MKRVWRGFSAAILTFALSYIVMPEAAYSHDEKAARIAADNQPEIFKNIGIEQKLGTKLPLKTTFRDQTGASVSLQDYLSAKPAVLVFPILTARCSVLSYWRDWCGASNRCRSMPAAISTCS